MLKIEIDKKSGFCAGVVNAIRKAENALLIDPKLYCLGDIVHNHEEVGRLEAKGLVTINHDELKQLKDCKVLIRAHGEPPSTYQIAEENNIELIDASCPVVLRLQYKINQSYQACKAAAQIVIYGKKGHAEVVGLEGHTNNTAIIISDLYDIKRIDFSKPIYLYSQTTKDIEGYQELISVMRENMHEYFKEEIPLYINDSICRAVSHRIPQLRSFAKKHDIIIFVSGRESSNGKLLFGNIIRENPKTFFVTNENELDVLWFHNVSSVGICGATSTPMWLMEKVAAHISLITK